MAKFCAILLLGLFTTTTGVFSLDPCTADNCQPPSCLCSSTLTPWGWLPTDAPQMIFLVFEGSLSTGSYPIYQKILGLTNPNTCPITATFFIDHEYTDYSVVFQAWHDGHEVGVQSITSNAFTGKNTDDIYHEIGGEAYYITSFGLLNSSDVIGERSPQSASGGDPMFEAIVETGLRYDASLVSRDYRAPFWPYTLDFQSTLVCDNGPCPSESFPGIWEFPVTDLIDGNNVTCNNLAQCICNNTLPTPYALLQQNYAYHTVQATPFYLPIPLAWLYDDNNIANLTQFLTEATSNGAYVVSLDRALAWFEQPVQLPDIASFQPWLCDVPRDGSCSTLVCNYNFTGISLTMGMCHSSEFATCPPSYPWVDNLPF